MPGNETSGQSAGSSGGADVPPVKPEPRDQWKKTGRKAGYAGSIVWNAVFIFVLNNLTNWNLPFIAPGWVAVLLAVNLSLGVTILFNIVFLAFDPPWFRYFERIVSGLLALLSTYVIYTIFPFDIPDPLATTVLQWCLIIAMVASVIGVIVALVKLVVKSG